MFWVGVTPPSLSLDRAYYTNQHSLFKMFLRTCFWVARSFILAPESVFHFGYFFLHNVSTRTNIRQLLRLGSRGREREGEQMGGLPPSMACNRLLNGCFFVSFLPSLSP